MSLRRTVTAIIELELIIALTILLHIGENASPGVSLYKFTPLLGAIVGSCLTFFSIRKSALNISAERSEAWIGYEKAGWILVCLGQAMWGLGESFWRYYSAIGDPPFPSLADAGYMFFPALCFIGLVLQPNAKGRLERTLVALDSLIAMGALLAISWYLLLGAIAQSPATTSLAKFISLYYPAADVSLLSCVIFLLMRGHSQVYQATARRFSLFALGLGLCLFATSDFIFNLQQNAGTYVDGTWVDLGEAIVRYRAGQGFKLPPSCANMPEVAPIVHAIGAPKSQLPTSAPLPSQDLPAKTPSWEISPMRNPSQSM